MSFLDPFRPADPYRRKPLRHQTELNPQGRLREGLVLAVLFEPGAWLRDYVNPGVTFTPTNTPVYGDSAVGGTASPGSGPAYLTLSAPALTPAAWTVSASVFFTGTYLGTGDAFFTSDGVGDVHFYIQGSAGSNPGQFTFAVKAPIAGWNAINYTGWHRLTATASAQTGTGTFYFDGVSQGTATITLGCVEAAALLGDVNAISVPNTLTSDIFVWNYAMSAAQVAQHYADPYGTVLRPRYPPLARRGIPPNKIHPSLMLMGVGP